MNSQITVLPNGLTIVTNTRKQLETVSLGIWVKTGSKYETEKTNGISHFLEHMAFKGTTTRTAKEITEEIEAVGGIPNAYTSREVTAYYAKMLKGDVKIAVDMIADILQNSTFPENELIKEREVVVQEIKQAIDTPDDVVFDYFQELAFQNQPLGRTILGPIETVRSFNQESLKNYIKSNYSASNMVLSAAGNIDHDEFVRLAISAFTNLNSSKEPIIQPSIYNGGFKMLERDIEQAHVVLGFKGFDYKHKNYYPSLVFSTLFGGGMSSRLFQEIREERGLVYSVYSFANSYSDNGLFGIYAGTGDEELKEFTPAVCSEIRKVRTDLVTEKELDRAKVQIKAGILMSLESSSAVSEMQARHLMVYGKLLPIEDLVERVENVTTQQMRDVANEIFASNLSYAAVGSISNLEDYEKIKEMIKV